MRCAVCVIVVLLALGAAFRPEPGAPAVGVLDTARVFSEAAKWQDIQQLLENRKELRQKEVDALAERVATLRKALEAATPGSEAFIRSQEALIQQEALLASTAEHYELELARADAAHYEGFSDEIETVVALLAKERGMSAVFQKQLDTSEGVWTSVLYADPQADLTPQVIALLNARHQKVPK